MWVSCQKPPLPYIRLEIKDSRGRIYLGYYTIWGEYLMTEGHYVIRDARYWRRVPKDSGLNESFLQKLRERLGGYVWVR